MAKDLRSFLKELEERYPQDLLRVRREVSPLFEVSAFIRKLDLTGRFPAVLFERVKGSRFPVVANLLADRRKYALALGLSEENLSEEVSEREQTRIPPRLIPDGPVKEVVETGEAVDLTKFPILTHSELDSGPYITMGVTVTKDPDTGNHDIGIFRHRLIDKDHLGIYYSWGKHLQYVHRKAELRNEPLPVAIAIGMHPALHVAAVSLVSSVAEADEFEVAGGLLGEPLEVTKCETVDLEVPAHAEIVIEGEIPPHERRKDGPFGEYTGHYGQVVDAPIINVKAITYRPDAIYQNVGICVEHVHLLLPLGEGYLLRELRRIVPTVKKVCLPASGVRYQAIISMEKVNEGDAKNVLMAALAMHPMVKTAIAVDPDIDVYNLNEVNWALATRVVPDRDLFIVPGARGNRLDPTTYDITRLQRDGMVTKMGIDATLPLGLPYELPPRLVIPGVEKIDIEEYLKAP